MDLPREAIDALFRDHNRTLNGLARRRVGRDDAEDVIQDAYLRLLELKDAERLADARGYLFRIASNMAIDWRRRQKSRSAYMLENGEREELAASEPAYAASVEGAIMVCKVQISLSQLPRCCRDAFLLSRLYGMSYPEIAERLNVSLRTVNRNVSRAVYHLDLAFGVCIGVDKSDDRRAPSDHEPSRDRQDISACTRAMVEVTSQNPDVPMGAKTDLRYISVTATGCFCARNRCTPATA